MVSTQGISMRRPCRRESAMYMSITSAIPDTMAEKMNTIGMSGMDHHGLALIDPKMKPTYPCSRNADGMPTMVTIFPTSSSSASASSEMSSDHSASAP